MKYGSRNLKETRISWKPNLSSDQNPGWMGYIGDYTTQLDRDYKKRCSNLFWGGIGLVVLIKNLSATKNSSRFLERNRSVFWGVLIFSSNKKLTL